MTLFERLNVERHLRSLHGWLGALVLPWIILAGLTGFYMNHKRDVLAYLPDAASYDPADFSDQTGAHPVLNQEAAYEIALRIRPAAEVSLDRDTSYRNRRVYTVDTGPDAVIVDRQTGFAWHKERYRITSYAPDGTLLGSGLRWSAVLSSLHQRGWVGTDLGRWLADITACTLVLFGLSGIVLFFSPRLRRRRNRKARQRAAAFRPSFPSSRSG